MRRLILGAAHTLMMPGEIFQDLREADLTRKILGKTLPYLDKSGITYKTVPLDLPLLERIDWINKTEFSEEKGDVFIEIHVNDGGKRGIENWFSGDDKDDNPSKYLATFLAKEMCATLKFDNQGAKSEYDHELGSLLILNQTKTISVATELLYIDNAEDIKILKDDAQLDNLAKVLVDTIKKYFDDVKDKPLPKASKKINMPGGAPGGFPSFPNLGNLGGGIGTSGAVMPNFNQPFKAPGGLGLPPVAGGVTPSTPSNSGALMDRDQRKEMIVNTYKKILGIEPKPADLGFQLNTAISEDDLTKKLLSGKEHEEMVKDAKDAKELRSKSTAMEAEIAQLKSKMNDLQKMHHNLNILLQHKNHTIMQMQKELVNRNVTRNGQYFDPYKR